MLLSCQDSPLFLYINQSIYISEFKKLQAAMDFQSEFSWLELEELHAPTQSFAAVVGQRYCFPNSAQYRLENEILSKSWIITEANGEVVFRVRGKKVDWYKSKRELVDENGKVVVYMEEKVCPPHFKCRERKDLFSCEFQFSDVRISVMFVLSHLVRHHRITENVGSCDNVSIMMNSALLNIRR